MNYQNKLIISLKSIMVILIFFGLWNSLLIGASYDEPFHAANGIRRLRYLISFGEYQNYQYANNQFYPGLYDTLSSSISYLIYKFNPNIFQNFFFHIKHFINFIFATLSIYGLYSFVKLFSKNELLATISSLLTVLNPFFFGHMGINPKDTIIFFSLIWFLYFFYKYTLKDKDFKNLILFSFFIGFGCGIRISFLAIIFPLILIGIFYHVKTFNYNPGKFLKKKILDIIICTFIISFLTLLTWPHLHQGNFNIILETLKNSISWQAGPRLGLINGIFYETSSTPKTYFLSFLLFKMPIYQSILFFISILLFFVKKDFFKSYINEFSKFIFLNLFIIFYIIFITIILNVKIYDGIRLFLFLIPFFCTICAFSLFHFIFNFKKNNLNFISSVIFIFLIALSLNRFIAITPYQYSYVNYNFIKLNMAENKFENDYWHTSWKELINNLPDEINGKKINNFNIGVCGGDINANIVRYYLSKKYKKFKITPTNEAHFIIMTNRISFNKNDRRTCFDIFKGQDLFFVKRGDLILSKFTKINELID
jgi:hypothetical protein